MGETWVRISNFFFKGKILDTNFLADLHHSNQQLAIKHGTLLSRLGCIEDTQPEVNLQTSSDVCMALSLTVKQTKL